MRLALVDNVIAEPQSGMQGFCPGCNQPVIAKCGNVRVPHWSHIRTTECDKWSEPETEWHRAWKNKFPTEWQEYFLQDNQTGEKHMADVRTAHGLFIEFQHSNISAEERATREKFYRNLVWIVDGTRLKNDFPRFQKAKAAFVSTSQPRTFHVPDPEKVFPSSWLNSLVPVIFDFLDCSSAEVCSTDDKILYCLFPIRLDGQAILVEFSHSTFVVGATNGQWLQWARLFMTDLKQRYQMNQIRDLEIKLQLQAMQSRRQLKFGRSRKF